MCAGRDRNKGVNPILHVVLAKKRVHSFMCAEPEQDTEGSSCLKGNFEKKC
jgi:hypothetical protein